MNQHETKAQHEAKAQHERVGREGGVVTPFVSTAMLTDIGTVITNGPSPLTKAAAIAPAGPINDYVGNCVGLKLRLQEASNLLNIVKLGIDATDATVLGLVNGVLGAINGTGGPSAACVVDLQTVATTGFNAASKAKQNYGNITAGNTSPIQDAVGIVISARTVLANAISMATMLVACTSASDDNTNKGLLQGIADTLA
jgi:hypothetical protein